MQVPGHDEPEEDLKDDKDGEGIARVVAIKHPSMADGRLVKLQAGLEVGITITIVARLSVKK
jgi:hypothetical protein